MKLTIAESIYDLENDVQNLAIKLIRFNHLTDRDKEIVTTLNNSAALLHRAGQVAQSQAEEHKHVKD